MDNEFRKIEVFGDSILKGIQLNPENKKYVIDNHIDIELLSRKHEVEIINSSKFGCTIGKGRMLLERCLSKNIKIDAVVMEYGGNDCDYNWKEVAEDPDKDHFPNTPLEVFVKTYKEMIEFLKKKGIQPILTNLPPIDPQRFFDWFCNGLNKDNVLRWLGSINLIYRHQETYSRAIEKIAQETGCPLVDLRGAFLERQRIENLLCEDGIHPNTEGQKVITKAFSEFEYII